MEEMFHKSIPFLSVFVVWLFVFIGMRHRRIRSEARRDVQLALLNKFQTGEEITKFMATDEGRRLLDQLATSEYDPRHRLIGMIVPACVLTSIGVALAIASQVIGERDLLIASFVIGAVGVGFFIAFALARRIMGALGSNRRDD